MVRMRATKRNLMWLTTSLVAVLLTMTAAQPLSAQTIAEEAEAEKAMQTLREGNLTSGQQALKQKMERMVTADLMNSAGDRRDDGDSVSMRLRVSLITCGQGDEMYQYYGHTAIRILRTDTTGLDLTFNYGVFDFDSDFFVWRFLLGETDYLCVAQPTDDFIAGYRRNGRYVEEQVLNMTQKEARRLLDALMDNIKPENSSYRYNFFYDNCATRVRDIIERNLDGQLQYPERPVERTMRDAVHFFCRGSLWSIFGQDLLLGAEADVPASGRELEFAPLILQQDFDFTLITDQTHLVRTFVAGKHRLLDLPPVVHAKAFPLSPFTVALILLVAVLVLGWFEYRRGRIVWPVDTALLVLQGVAGLIVTFMFFFSVHPTVGSNWLVWILNPLPLLGIVWQGRGARRKRYVAYHGVAAVVTVLFLVLSPFLPQKFGAPIIILALVLLVRNVTNILTWLKVRTRPTRK